VCELARRHGWESVRHWGAEGCGPGDWPTVLIFHRDSDDGFELAEWDCKTRGIVGFASYWYPTREIRDAATDELAFVRCQRTAQPWVDGIATMGDVPAILRGPYSMGRFTRALATRGESERFRF
jgi:hypothetical protein